ncbi:MAG: hypothetical protein M3345_05905 [Actinomycetota bacterium]|nr:hypothetical protein [Actinomycetota bacterium]
MKRSIGGGAHRGPVAVDRQRGTLRLMQALLVLIAAGCLLFAGYSLGKARGIEEARRSGDLGAGRSPGGIQVAVLSVLGLAAVAAALALQDGGLRIPTPGRLDGFDAPAQGSDGPVPASGDPEPAEPVRERLGKDP